VSTAVAKKKKGAITDVSELSGFQKVAVFLMAVGEEASAEITKGMSPEDVETISFEIARMDRVDPRVVEAVLEEWQQTERAAFSLAQGGVDYARRILEKAFGNQRATAILKRIESQLHDHVSLVNFRNADPAQLTAVIRNEHPQIIAVLLAFLDPDHTAAVLKSFDTKLGSDILLRMAQMEKLHPDALKVIESSLGADSDLSMDRESSKAGGPETVAEILNRTPSGIEKDLMEGLVRGDPELAETVKDLMFVFEDIVTLDDQDITRVLKDVETKELALALKVASDELSERIMGTLTTRARDALNEEIEFLGPVRVSDVEGAQAKIVRTVRTLEEAGEIVIGASDDMVVE
jgi:flagellar motor switch protein FliG